uniref:Placental growth factor b n=1 Tax=Salmo trutta TaxID=8032 RepID=A0A673X3Z9_SALTR
MKTRIDTKHITVFLFMFQHLHLMTVSLPLLSPPLLSPHHSFPLSSSPVLMFQDVWGRSFCRTIEKLVEVVQEYPGEVEHIYSPSCVPLVRCAGCCGDENLECHPTRTSNVTMQVIGHIPSEDGCHVVRSSVYLIFVCQDKEKCFFRLFHLQLVQQRVHSQLLKIKPAECQPPRR